MSDPVCIRRATPADVRGIARVAREGWHAAHTDIIGADAVEEMLAAYHTPAAIYRRVTREPAITVVAVADDVVGFAVVSPDAEVTTRWHLGAIYVDNARRGMGIGGRLLDAAESQAATHGAETVRLAVMGENEPARGFYEAAGYELVAMDHNPDLDVEDAIYERSL